MQTKTVQDYLLMEDEKRYELIYGRLYEMPSPTFEHQLILKRLMLILDEFVSKNKLGEVIPAPFDVILSEEVVVQPDIVFISNEGMRNIKEGRLFGKPQLVVEIVSKGTFHRDTVKKKEIYQKFGIGEYWLVFPSEQVVQVWTLSKDKYTLYSFAELEGKVSSKLLKGFQLDLKEVFGGENS